MDTNTINEKQCSTCKRVLPAGEFPVDSGAKSGIGSQCKECRKIRRTLRRTSNAEGIWFGRLIERPVVDGKRLCKKCGEKKDIADFYNLESSSTGVLSYCKQCCNSSVVASTSKIRGYLGYKRRMAILGSSKGARSRREEFRIGELVTTEELMDMWNRQGGRCCLSGVPMSHGVRSGYDPRSASLDRIDNSKGYSADNVRLVCSIVNTMRRTLPDSELVEWCSCIVNFTGRSSAVGE